MATETIRIRVDEEAARLYRSAPEERRRKFDALLSIRLREAAGSETTLEDIMKEIGRSARERGLTEETLAELLIVDDQRTIGRELQLRQNP